MMILVGADDRWHSATTVVAYHFGLSENDTVRLDGRVADLIALHRNFAAIVSSPEFAAFEQAVGRAAFERFAAVPHRFAATA